MGRRPGQGAEQVRPGDRPQERVPGRRSPQTTAGVSGKHFLPFATHPPHPPGAPRTRQRSCVSGSVAAVAVAVGTGRVAAASDVSPLGRGAQASRVRLARPESGRQRGHLPCGALGEGLPASPSSRGPGVSGSGPCSPRLCLRPQGPLLCVTALPASLLR